MIRFIVGFNQDPPVPLDRRWEIHVENELGRFRICCCIDEVTARQTADLMNIDFFHRHHRSV